MKPIAKILNLIMVILGMTILIISCNNSPGRENTDSLNVDEFNNPPIDARPGALWPWLNGYVDTVRMTYELEQMKEKGMRGPVLWDIGSLRDPLKMIPAGPAFMGDTSLMYIHHAMDVCRRLGLQLSVFASSSWNAGGSWIGPENASKEICSSKIIIEGPAVFHSSLPLPEDARMLHSDVKIFAIPDKKSNKAVAQSEIIDLTAKMKNDILTWEVPPGTWIILRFVERNTGQDLECPSPNSHGLIIDHLSAEAAATHINYMMDRIQDGRPNLEPIKTFMLDSYEVWPADDWTPGFAEEFKSEFDYDPLPWLPALAGVVIDNQDLTNRFLHDYHKMVSDLLIKNHFSTIKKLLNDRGVGLLSEAGHGGYARVEPLKALGASDIPMGEFWNGSRFWVVKEAASAAHIYGKKIVSSETLTGWRSWKDGPMHYKRLFDVALCAGLNQVTFHTFAHNPALAGLPGFVYHAGEHFNVNNTWWKYAGPMLSYMSRCSYLLQKGQFVADLCLYYGDQAPNRVPSRRIDPTLTPLYDSTKCLHCGQDKTVETPGLGHGHDYDYINEEIILSKLDVQKKQLVIPGGPGYALLVLPDSQAISPDVLNKLESLVSKGAVVYGPKPTQSNSLQDYPECDSMVKDLGKKIWGECDGIRVKEHRYGKGKVIWGVPLDQVMLDLGLEKDFYVKGIDNQDQKIDYIHRRVGNQDLYFVSNSSLDRQHFTASFRIPKGREAWFWHPEDGSIEKVKTGSPSKLRIEIDMKLAPAGSVFVVFTPRKTSFGKDIPDYSDDGQMVSHKVMSGPWEVTFDSPAGDEFHARLNELIDWTQSDRDSIRYFSGTATYRKYFVYSDALPQKGEKLILDLGNVKEVAELRLNGNVVDTLWKQPYLADISSWIKSGENKLEILVTNLWNNRLVGDAGKAPGHRSTRTNIQSTYRPDQELLSSGLLGPVQLKIYREDE